MNELGQAHKTEARRWFKLVLFAAMLLFAFYASTHMVAAGDTWVAMACGRHFANHGVDTIEPFSFNSHPAGPSDETLEKFPEWSHKLIRKWHPTGWINQNWLTHLTFYKLASWFGTEGHFNYNALVYWKFGIYFAAVFCVYAIGKLLGAGDFLPAAGACFAMVVGRTFYDIRPSGFSNLLTPVFILVLALTIYKNYRLIWLLVPLIVFWANAHGGYIYAFIMMVPFIGIHLLLRVPRRWTISLGFIGLWLVMYLMSYKFISNTQYLTVQRILGNPDAVPILFKDKILIIWAVMAIISIGMAALKKVESPLFYAYHIGVGAIYFLSLAPRFFLSEIPDRLTKDFSEIYGYFLFSSQLIFLFVSIVGCLLVLAMALKKERFIVLPAKAIYHSIGAGIVAFIAMILFNPFHLTNLTHTFEISVSKHAESWRQVNEWKPAFDWMDKMSSTPNPVGDQEAFAVLCVLAGVALLFWLVGQFSKPKPPSKRDLKKRPVDVPNGDFEWPKIDLAIIIISLLSIYMAIRSRRFIATAGSAAAPAVFLMVLQSWHMFTARFSWKTKGLLRPIAPGAIVQDIVCFGTVLVVLGLGTLWTVKYKYIYLDPWPIDDRYTSVFMRMTASHLKPFEVCEFINDNQISGRVFNYWTEGGAVAFGQKPDPQTGQIPLKLFMDGRAQAAYNHDKFRLWQMIHSGGPPAHNARIQDGKVMPEQLEEVGQWINEQLRKYDVWVVLMPKTQENSTFMRALERTPDWKTAYLDNTQHLRVDIKTPQGKQLIDKVLNDEAVFPDAYSKNMTISTAIIENNHHQRFNDLYPLIKAAFEEHPNPASTLAMTRLVSFPRIREQIISDFQAYLDDFIQHQEVYQNQDGYFPRLASAEISARFLLRFQPEEKGTFEELSEAFRNSLQSINRTHIW